MGRVKDKKFYNNIPSLRAEGYAHPYAKEEVEEYMRCMEDPEYFITNYCYIISDSKLQLFDLYDCQKEKIKLLHENRKVILMEGRQQGKTTTIAAYLLWFVLFNENRTVAILAHKEAGAKDVLSRIKGMFENLPFWLQQGVRVWNIKNIDFENNSRIFAEATSESAIRGKSCVTGDAKISLYDEKTDSVYYGELSNFINNDYNSEGNDKMLYAVYETTNNKNKKNYIGFHKIKSFDAILSHKSKSGSIFKDGYMGSGKLIKKAIIKYGVDSFSQKLLSVFDNEEDSKNYEKELVNEEFVAKETNYNIALGGSINPMPGEKNPFYGKKHSKETKKMLSEICTGNKFHSTAFNNKIIDIKNNIEYIDFIDYKKANNSITRKNIIDKIGNGELKYDCDRKQKVAMDKFNNKLSDEEKSKLFSINCKNRFTGTKKSDEHKRKISEGIRKWNSENPEKVKARLQKINSNKNKINKTAEKHRGMKRSKETCKKISEALKGNVACNDGINNRYFKKDKIPQGWNIGFLKKDNENSD